MVKVKSKLLVPKNHSNLAFYHKCPKMSTCFCKKNVSQKDKLCILFVSGFFGKSGCFSRFNKVLCTRSVQLFKRFIKNITDGFVKNQVCIGVVAGCLFIDDHQSAAGIIPYKACRGLYRK